MSPPAVAARKGRIARGVALLAALFAALLLPPQAEAEGDPGGSWSGSYSCGNVADNPFTLTLESTGRGMLTGELRFAVPEQPGQTGAYHVRGRFDAGTRRITLLPAEWIERPSGYSALGLSGTLHENGLSMAGELRGCRAIGHPRFLAERAGAAAPGSAPGIAAAPLAPPAAGALEGRWRGSIACARPEEVPLAVTILEDDGALAGVATLGWPSFRGREVVHQDEQFVLDGDVAASGEVSLRATVLLERRSRLRALAGRLNAAGDRLEGEVEGMPAGWRCEAFHLAREAAPDLPELAAAGIAAGSWAGFEFASRGDPDRMERIRWLGNGATLQSRITLAGEGRTLHGRYEVARPVAAPPARQDRYSVGLRPLLRLPDGRIGFAPMKLERAEGQLAGRQGQGRFGAYILAIAPGPDGTITTERIPAGILRRGAEADMQPAGPAQVAALDAGEAAQVAFPGAIGGRLAAAPSLDAQCRVLRDWAQPVADAGDLGAMTRTTGLAHSMPLFDDAAFEPVFGLPYVQTTQVERTAVSHLMTWVCARRLEAEVLRHDAVNYPLGSQQGFDDVTARMMNRRESAGWLGAALSEIGDLPVEAASLQRLRAVEAEGRSRAGELADPDRARLAEAIAEKRNAIAVAALMARVASLPTLPDTAAAIPPLRQLVEDAGTLRLTSDETARLDGAVRSKAEAILRPLLAAAEAAARQAPATLDGLAALTGAQRALAGAVNQLGPRIPSSGTAEAARAVRARRAALIADPGIQDAFAAAMRGLEPRGDPRAVVRAAALRYVDAEHLGDRSPQPAYARAAEAAAQRLEIESIAFADRSAGGSPGEPSAKEMLLAVKATFDRINRQLSGTFARCQARQFRDDPLMAMECLGVLAAGAGQQMRMSITRFEKLGCANPGGLPGYICDYVLGFESNSPFMRGRMAELMGGGSHARGRFIRTSDGWLFERLD